MSRHAAIHVRRAPILLAVAGALVVGGLADRASAPAQSAAIDVPTVQAMPVAAPANAYSSSWFCAGATDGFPAVAGGRVVVYNAGRGPAEGTVTVVSSSGTRRRQAITVGPASSTSVPETVAHGGPWVGAIVDVNGGSVAVSQVTDGPIGRTDQPCASSGSANWYFPSGQTRVNAGQFLLLLNPYPTDSIVDLTFYTNQGQEQPQDFQGVDVPPGGLVAVDIGVHLRRRSAIATTVAARTGAVVAWQTNVVIPPTNGQVVLGTPAATSALADPAWPDAGVTVSLGAPSTGTEWVWPSGYIANGVQEQYVIFNPGTQPADVKLAISLPQGSAEPFTLTVGPGQVVPVESEQSTRIPTGALHSADLIVTNGVPVVAMRTTSWSGQSHASVGNGAVLGARLLSDTWLIPTAAGDNNHLGYIYVYNPSDRPVRARLTWPTGTQDALVPPHTPFGFPQAGTTDVPLEVTASDPVYVGYDLYGQAKSGIYGVSLSTAVPLHQ